MTLRFTRLRRGTCGGVGAGLLGAASCVVLLGCASLLGIDSDYQLDADAGVDVEDEPEPEDGTASEPAPGGVTPTGSAPGGPGTPFGGQGGDGSDTETEPDVAPSDNLGGGGSSSPPVTPGGPGGESGSAANGGEFGNGTAGTSNGVSGNDTSGDGSETDPPGNGGDNGQGASGGVGPSPPVGGAGQGGVGGTAPTTTTARVLRVQSGASSITSGASSGTAPIQQIDLDRSFLVFGTSFNSESSSNTEVSGQIRNSTELVFERYASSGTPTVPVHYYVAEFASGVRVQRGSRVLEDATERVQLAQGVDLAKSFPLISFRNQGGVYGLDDFVRAEITTSSELSLSMYQAFGNGTVEWQVVSFEDPSTTVQHGTVQFTSDQLTLFAALPTAVDLSKTWLIFTYQVADISERANEVLVRGLINTPSEIVFERSGSGATVQLTYYAVSFGNGTTVQSGARAINDSETVVTNSINAVDPTKSIAAAGGFYQRSGATFYSADTNPGYSTFLMDIGDGSGLTFTRGASGAGSALNWFVVAFE